MPLQELAAGADRLDQRGGGPAAPDAFWSAGARLILSADLRATTRLTIAAMLACDITAEDVHYDLRGADGSARRVLTAFRVAPGLGISVAWRL